MMMMMMMMMMMTRRRRNLILIMFVAISAVGYHLFFRMLDAGIIFRTKFHEIPPKKEGDKPKKILMLTEPKVFVDELEVRMICWRLP